jgi:transcriptional regulator with XRE-family HTH domain
MTRYIIKEIPDTKGVYDQIEAQRRFKGISQADLADAVGVSTRTYQNWIKCGTTEKNIDKLKRAIQKWEAKP